MSIWRTFSHSNGVCSALTQLTQRHSLNQSRLCTRLLHSHTKAVNLKYPRLRTSAIVSTERCLPHTRLIASAHTDAHHIGGSKAHVVGPKTPELLSCTIGQMLKDTAAKHPLQKAFVCREEAVTLTYKDLDEQSDVLARGLQKLGVAHGDRVGVWLPNCSQYVLLQYATAKIGAILTTMNPAYRAAEAVHAMNLVECKVLVITPEVSRTNYVQLCEEMCPELNESEPRLPRDKSDGQRLNLSAVPTLEHIINVSDMATPGMLRYKDVVNFGGDCVDNNGDANGLVLDITPTAQDVINIQFTSGTTGKPKAAALTHANILNNGLMNADRLGYTMNDSICVPVPLYHCFGLVIGNLAALTRACTVVYPSATFNPEKVLQAVHEERCTSLYGVPTHFIAELSHPNFNQYDLSSLRTGVMAGSSCPEEVMQRVIKQMHMKDVTICYGMTETSPVSFQTNQSDPLDKRVSTVGRIHPHLEAKLVRPTSEESEPDTSVPKDDDVCDIGEAGELWVRGYAVMKEYYNGDPKNHPVTDDGWIQTGDLCVMDQERYLSVVGRIKDIIIRGGENIYPREIEEVVFKVPGVQQVSVVGVRNELFGEEVCAVVAIDEDAFDHSDPHSPTAHSSHVSLSDAFDVEITARVREAVRNELAHYKVPSVVVVMEIEDIPITVTGKIKKKELTQQVEKILEKTRAKAQAQASA
ncbi:hypothetical protein SARC_09153 [Sphaeroforma arctica JP610]|uniref:AMP-dependent synthetase/ligase domain-containing protein n=1 Tax=Sphaeroforma arctica JP610 TaxID=667725 RepID=A0A0L0FNU8_9EUKA|nr:hypothetical protein SARC_09153 [Sphaeroforma arctica JP610]KNC78419.1 hypothetical protein SARC_09153 [Sphaeroforma arctica JP610]|eukprot:XP_014152321.1 hypothetical protein SARC_09153 [Sphaeroforma arctica JP610]